MSDLTPDQQALAAMLAADAPDGIVARLLAALTAAEQRAEAAERALETIAFMGGSPEHKTPEARVMAEIACDALASSVAPPPQETPR